MVAAPYLKVRIVVLATALILLAMTVRCWVRSAEWRNNGTLYAAAYRDQPNAVGPLQLFGQWLVDHGEPAEGIDLLRRAVEIDPGFTDARVSLGMGLLVVGDAREAVSVLQLALMQDPENPITREALGRAVGLLDALSTDSLQVANEAADRSPNDVEARIALIEMQRETGHLEEALAQLATHDVLFSDLPQWNATYAVTLVIAGKQGEAIERYRRCVALDTGNVQVKVELAMLLLERRSPGDVMEARRHCDDASELTAALPHVLVCQAEVFVAEGEINKARELYRKAINSLPRDAVQRTMLEQRLNSLGNQ